MGVSAAIRGSFGFLLDRQHDDQIANVTPANALQSLFRRQRHSSLPITPVAILRSMMQLEDLQALLWAWTLVAIVLLFAFWTNPSETSFRPFLTDLVFRERLRLLNEDDVAESPSQSADPDANTTTDPTSARSPKAFSSLLSSASYSSGPFALTFGSKVALSLRTPPFHRKDLGIFSIVTINQSMPIRSLHDQQTASQTPRSNAHNAKRGDSSVDCTSLFIGAFGKWWVLGLGIPGLPSTSSASSDVSTKTRREELEENRTEVSAWGIIEMRSIDPHPESRRNSVFSQGASNGEAAVQHQSQPRTASGFEPSARTASSPSPPPTKDATTEAESEDCLSITAMVSRSQGDIADLQEQLTQVRSASTRACEALEVDLEELRTKKREEERLRAEIKSRTKALDDSKRQVDSSRREADRRLKAANTARALKQANIQHRKEQIESLNKRRAAIIAKKGTSAEKCLQRSEELSALIAQANSKADTLREEIDGLRQEMETAHEELQVEKTNARAIQEGAFSRDLSRGDAMTHVWNPAVDASGHDALYSHMAAAAAQDPFIDSLARLEERSLAGQRFSPSAFDGESSMPVNKLKNAHTDTYDDLGTSVLRSAFHRANAAAVADGRDLIPTAAHGPANPSLQNASNFEAIKQAFQPTVATEEDGRRSWSAFDVWRSDLRNGAHQRTQWASGGANASADSLPHFSASNGFLPLDRSSSAEHMSIQGGAGQGDTEQTRNLSKVKRAFRWPFRPSQVQDDLV